VLTSRRATAAVLLAWSLLAIGDNSHAGYYNSAGLALILIGFVAVAVVAAIGVELAAADRTTLLVPVMVCVVDAVLDPTRPFLYLHGADLHAIEAVGIATAAAAALSLAAGACARISVPLALALGAATGIVTIVVIGNPNIDVWEILQQSSTGLLHGDNMYRQRWAHSTGLQTVYPYLPGSTLVLAPFRWLVGDVRFGLLTASIVTAAMIKRFGTSTSAALALLVVAMPGFAYLVNRSWTEPLLVAALAVTVFALSRGRTGIAIAGLVVALASKQHIVLLLPLFAVWPSFGLRRTLKAVLVSLLVVAPWIIAGPRAFWHDAVHANLSLGVRTSSLNVPALLLRHGDRVGFWFVLLALGVTYLIVLWRVPRTPSGLALSAALVMWSFDLANKQTYFNHYVLPLGLLLIAVAASDGLAGGALRHDRRAATGAGRSGRA
jgi:hypothetical protein